MDPTQTVVNNEGKVITPDVVQPDPNKVEDTNLVSKVSAYKPPVPDPVTPVQDINFNVTDISKIEDPQARKYAEEAYKSFQRDYTRKTQDLAVLRKDYESKITQTTTWTPEKIQELLKDQDFVKSAQLVSGVNPTEDESMMSEGERKRLADVDSKMNILIQQNERLAKSQQDKDLTVKYANYAADIVDTTVKGLLSGTQQATREDIWKVVDYEAAVKRAYDMGKKDERDGVTEKVNSISTDGNTVVSSGNEITFEKGETGNTAWQKIMAKNLAKVGRTTQVRN